MKRRDILRNRPIEYLVIHTSASSANTTTQGLQRYFFVEKLWGREGYHSVVEPDGDAQVFIDDKFISNGIKEYAFGRTLINNNNSLNRCYIGGINSKGQPRDTRTPAQLAWLEAQVRADIAKYPDIQILGHNQIALKACPCFNVPNWLRSIGIPEKHIFTGDRFKVLATSFPFKK
jgi:N-acetylmuramoyl-L-alanine amidase